MKPLTPVAGLLLAAGLMLGVSHPASLQAQDATASTPAGPEVEEKSPWERSASLGFTLTDGNSDTLLLTADVLAVKKWEQKELGLGVSGAYGKNGGDKNNESLRGFIQFNRLMNERWYVYARQEGFYDSPADLHYRFTTSPGAGYYFIKKEEASLSGEFGPGFIAEKQGSDESEFFTLRFAERYTRKLSETARLWQTAEFLPKVDDFEKYLFNFEIGVESALTEAMNLKVVLQDFYNNKPADGRDHNDIRLVTSVVYNF